MRERLRIGEVARLVGVTPKTVRHYEKIGLLKEPERSESGYRLYSADDLLRLNRVKRLRSLGLSLERIGYVLGEGDGERTLEDILRTLRGEVEAEMERLQERRRRIEAMLSGEKPEHEASPSFEKAIELLGEHLSGVSERAMEQEKRFWSVLDAFEWPEGYREENEALFRYYAEHPEEYRELVAVGESLAEIADLPEDDPRVREAADALAGYFERYPPPEDLQNSRWAAEDPIGRTMLDLTVSSMSPAQRRVMALLAERAEEDGEGA